MPQARRTNKRQSKSVTPKTRSVTRARTTGKKAKPSSKTRTAKPRTAKSRTAKPRTAKSRTAKSRTAKSRRTTSNTRKGFNG